MKKTSMKKDTVVPTAIKTIVVINILISILLFLFSISLFVESQVIKQNPEEALNAFMKAAEAYPSIQFTQTEGREYILKIAQVAPYIGAGFFLIAIIHLLLAIFIWKKRSWARMVQIILSILMILYTLIGISAGAIVFNILILLIEGWIASYLLFTPQGKKTFM